MDFIEFYSLYLYLFLNLNSNAVIASLDALLLCLKLTLWTLLHANFSNLIVLDGPNLGPVKDNGSDRSIGTDTWESSLYQRKRGKRAGNHVYKKSTICQMGVNKSNLVTINRKQSHKVQQVSEKSRIMLVNAQSMKNKEHALLEHIDDLNTDILGITETWITNNDKDKVWKNSCCFNIDGWKAEFQHRKGRPGGGLCLVYRSHIKVKRIKAGEMKSFEFDLWRACYKNVSLHIMLIYRPPRSLTHPVETAMFLEEYPEFLTGIIKMLILVLELWNPSD